MGKLVLIIAKSGSGKSSSLSKLTAEEAMVISCSGKELPFKTDIKPYIPTGYPYIISAIQKSTKPMVIIDDANYMMTFDEMGRILETGYVKFTQMAKGMYDMFKAILDKDSDQIFYIMAHEAEREGDDSQIKFKTTGKMLSSKIVLEGLTNILLTTDVVDGEFVFRVKTDGTGVKSPIGMFEEATIPNDLKLVDTAIRGFYK